MLPCPARAARGLRSHLATGAARAGALLDSSRGAAERAAAGRSAILCRAVLPPPSSSASRRRPTPPGAFTLGRARRPPSLAGSSPARAVPRLRLRLGRARPHACCVARSTRVAPQATGKAGRAGAIVVARGEERPGGAASGAAVSASASCRSAAAFGRCRVTPRSGGAGRAVRGEAFGQRRPQREAAGTARAGGESGDPRPAFPERRGVAAFAALPSVQHVADSGEPGVSAAARAGGSGERARCCAGRSRPALRSAEAFSRPSWERHKGHQKLELSCQGEQLPSIGDLLFPLIQLPCGRCGGAEEGWRLGTVAGIGGARAPRKEL